jgi:heat shock protein HslJ
MNTTQRSAAAAGLAALVFGCTTVAAPSVSPEKLAGSSWHVTGLNGGGVQTRTMTIMFEDGRQAVGNAACNDYRYGYSLEGQRLTFEKRVVLTTDRTCDPDTMDVEDRFLATLGGVNRATIAPSGSLVLNAEDERRIVARPG